MSNDGNIRQLQGVARRIRAIGVRSEDMGRAGRKMAEIVAKSNRRQFSTKGAYYGTPWKPLKPRTLMEKMAQGFPADPLVRTGAMKREFTSLPMGVQEITRTSVRLGGKSKISRYQQYGTHRNGKRAIPPRVIQRVSRQMNADILKAVNEYLMKGKT